MRIAQIVLPETSWYERKCQAIDHAILTAKHEVTVTSFEGAMSAGADLAHLYATAGFTPPPPSFAIPYIAAGVPRRRSFTWRKRPAPRLITSPLVAPPEAVADAYFAAALRAPKAGAHSVGVFGRTRPGVFAMLEQTAARIQRFRDDIEWRI